MSQHGGSTGRHGHRPVRGLGPALAALLLIPPLTLVGSPSYADHAGGPVIVDVAVGTRHACALSELGAVWCWGDNGRGQLGTGSLEITGSDEPQPVVGVSDAVAIAAGAHHTCVTHSTATVSCWGGNATGQLGDGSTDDSPSPVEASGLTDVEAVTAGRAHTCAMSGPPPDQRLHCWGSNGFGQLGLGSARDAELYFGSESAGQALGHDSVDADPDGGVLVGAGLNRVWSFDADGLFRQLWRVTNGQVPLGGIELGPVAASPDGGGWAADREPGSPGVYRLAPDGSFDQPISPIDGSMGCSDAAPCRIRGLASLPDGAVVALVTRAGPDPAGWLRRLGPGGAVGNPVKVPGDSSRLTDVAVSPNETGTSRSVFVAAGERIVRFTTALSYQSEFSIRQLGDPCDVADDYTVEGVPISDDPAEDESDWTYTHDLSVPVVSRIGSAADGGISLLIQYERVTSTLVERGPSEPEPEAPVNTGANYTETGRALQPMCLARVDAFGPGSGTLDGVPTDAAEGTDLHASSDVTSMPDGGFLVADDDAFEDGPRRSRLVRLDAAGGEVAGYGRVTFRSLPTEVAPVTAWRNLAPTASNELTSLAAGLHHTCVTLKRTAGANPPAHAIGCWGSDSAGQLGRDPVWSGSPFSPPPDEIGGRSSFVVEMDLPSQEQYAGIVAAGGDHTCHVRSSLISCFGDGEDGQLGGDPPRKGWRVESPLEVTQLELGDRFTCAVVEGRADCWGADEWAQLGSDPSPLTAVTRVSAGRSAACAVDQGHVHCWGDPTWGQVPGPGEDPVRAPQQVVFPQADFATQPPGDLDGAVTLTFTAPVAGITQDNPALTSSTTGRAIAHGLVCRDADGGEVACTSDEVRSATLTPDDPPVPGEELSVTVNPPGTSPVTSAGSPIDTRTDRVRAATTFDDLDLTGSASWGRQTARRAADGSYLRERTSGASFVHGFRGRRLTVLLTFGPEFGRATLQVDDEEPLPVDTYAREMRFQVPVSVEVPSRGAHELTITVLGTKRPRSGDTFVGFDGVEVGRARDGSPTGTASWGTVPVLGATDGSVSRTSTRRASLTVPFAGTGIAFTTLTGPDQGAARLFVDGALHGRIDNDAPTAGETEHAVLGLGPGLHSLRIEALGRGAGNGRDVSVDDFEVQ